MAVATPAADAAAPRRRRSTKQQEASRDNGARSRGPVTEEGKSRSAENALKHGLFAARYVTLPGESDDEFRALRNRVAVDLGSKGEAEGTLAHTVATAAWREQRLDAAERALWDPAQPSPLADAEGRAKLDLLSRLQQRNQALQMRARVELRRRRAEREAAAEERTTALTEQRNTIEWAQELELTRMKAELAEAKARAEAAEARLAALEAQLAAGTTEPAAAAAPATLPPAAKPRPTVVRNEPETADSIAASEGWADGYDLPPPLRKPPPSPKRALAKILAT